MFITEGKCMSKCATQLNKSVFESSHVNLEPSQPTQESHIKSLLHCIGNEMLAVWRGRKSD